MREERACDVTDRPERCYRYAKAVTERDEFLPSEVNAFRHSRVSSDPVSLHFSSFFPKRAPRVLPTLIFSVSLSDLRSFLPANIALCAVFQDPVSTDLFLHKSSFIVRSFPEDVPSSTLSLTSN